jgi:hypothetical protein
MKENDMNMTMNQPPVMVSLATSGMIVNVEVNVWSATKQDQAISKEVTTAHNADDNAARVVKHLLAGDPIHKKLLNHRQTIYNWVKKRTYDWSGSNRYLPVSMLQKFKNEFDALEQEYEILKQEFVAKYPDIVAGMAFKQGSMFDANEYPSADQVASKFRIKLFVHPVPENDFRVAIANDIKEELEKHYASEASSKVEEIMRDATERLVEFIKRIAHACREVEAEGDGKVRRPKVYEGTIDGAKEMCELLKEFNLTGDSRLEDMRQDLLATLNDVTAKDIRESDATRSHVKSEMDKIMNKFGLVNL